MGNREGEGSTPSHANMNCKFTWEAPYLLQNGKTITVTQICSLPIGHSGNHKSLSKVIHK